jgi:2'-5' RNA ligase
VRLFVAVDPPPEAVTHLRNAASPVRAALATELPGLRWVDPAQWHLTLTFCGDVEERIVERVTRRLERAAQRHPPLALSFRGGGSFPRASRAGVLWVGVAGAVDGLRGVAASTSAAARREGIAVDDRRYRPHLTLARVSTPADLRSAVEALALYSGPAWTASEIHLVQSRLGAGEGNRAVHERVATWPLGE